MGGKPTISTDEDAASIGERNDFFPKHDNIMNLAKAHNFHQLIVKKDTWDGSSCLVFQVDINPSGYGCAYGHTKYSSGDSETGLIRNSGIYSWRVLKELPGYMRGTINYADGSLDVIESDGRLTHYSSKNDIPAPVCPKCGNPQNKMINHRTGQEYYKCSRCH